VLYLGGELFFRWERLARYSNPSHAKSSLPTAYSDAKLGKKKLCLSCVPVSRRGSFVCWFDVSMRYQAIKRLFFSCIRIFSPFFNAPAAHNVTQDCQFFVVDGDALCHLTGCFRDSMSTRIQQISASRLIAAWAAGKCANYRKRGEQAMSRLSGAPERGRVVTPWPMRAFLPRIGWRRISRTETEAEIARNQINACVLSGTSHVAGQLILHSANRETKMKKLSLLSSISVALVCAAAPASFNWSSANVTPISVDRAEARIGRPLTPMSVAGVSRRVHRREYRRAVVAGAAIGTAAVAGAAAGEVIPG
jgi:hypothetical protein